MAISFCKSCQSNNVNTRIEWRPNPNNPGKNKPFDIDKEEWHNCPYWKPDPNYRPERYSGQTLEHKIQLSPEDTRAFQRIEQEANGPSKTITEQMIRKQDEIIELLHEIKRVQEGFFKAWTAENSFKTATKRIKKETKKTAK